MSKESKAWQPKDAVSFLALPEEFKEIIQTGKAMEEIRSALNAALQRYAGGKQKTIRTNIFRCMGETLMNESPSDDE